MGKSLLFSSENSSCARKRLIAAKTNPAKNRRNSQEIKLQVVDTFRSSIKVKSILDNDVQVQEYGGQKFRGIDVNRSHSSNNKICWWEWEPPLECLPLDFCRDTSLHGLKYVGQQKRHLMERVFWLIAFATGVCVAFYLISDGNRRSLLWDKYQASPVIVAFETTETHIDKIPFPAVTICNMNKVLKKKAEQYIADAENENKDNTNSVHFKNLYNLNHVCEASKSFSKLFNFSSGRGKIDKILLDKSDNSITANDTSRSAIQDFLQQASQSCEDMIPLCIWHGTVVNNCSTLFRPIETDFGKCCTFNMVPQTLLRVFQNDTRDDENDTKKWALWNAAEGGLFPADESNERLEFPRRQIRAGKSFGLSILLDPDLEQYFCTTSDSVGFRLSTHLSAETPHVVDFGLGINPNSEVFIDVRPEITTAASAISSYDLDKRQCYFPGEFSLKFWTIYSSVSCIDECLSNLTYNNCGCVRYYMPRNNTQELCNSPEKFICVDSIQTQLAETGLKTFCNRCLPSCTEINYATETTFTPMQQDSNIWQFNDSTTAHWSKNSVSIVHIYFGTDSIYARVRKQLYGPTDLIANTGGLLGLCLGFSGLSAMEVLYFLSLRAWCRARRKRTFRARVVQKFRDIWVKLKGIKTYGKQSRENSTDNGSYRTYQNRVLPAVSISGNVTQNRILGTVDSGLPDYSSVANEINPYYTKRYWQDLEMNTNL